MNICGSLMDIYDDSNREAQISIFMTAIQSLLP